MADLHEPVEVRPLQEESAARIVWKLAWPAVALNSLQVVNTLLDRGFIGRLHANALTAHGSATNVMFLMFSLAMALATGATALVSRAYGANDASEYRMAARQSLRVAIIGGFLVGGLTAGLSGWVSNVLIPPDDREAMIAMHHFVLAYSLGLPAIWVVQVLAGSLRGIGDTKSPMVISGIQIGLHILLNYLLIFPPRQIGPIHIPGAALGLTGAGLALSFSAWMASIGYIVYVRRTPLGPLFSVQPPQLAWLRRILRIAMPAAMMASLRVFSLTAFTLILKSVPNGSAAIGAMSVGFAIESVMFMPAMGLSMAAGALVGQSLGMKRPDRAERLGWTAGHHGAMVTLCLCVLVFAFSPAVATVLLQDKTEMIGQATQLLRMLCLTEILFAYAMILLGAMQGAGDTTSPLWITIISLWGLRVPLAFLLALPVGFKLGGALSLPYGAGLGSHGAWIAMASTQGVQGLLAIYLFRRGKWKLKRV